MRKLILEMGERYQIRIQIYTSYFILLCTIMLIFIFGVLSGAVDSEILSLESWISFSMFTAYLFISCLAILLKTSYLNREIFIQMRFLIRRREIYSRLVRDP